MSIREEIMKNPQAYMMFGDVDKPFHRPECECDECEKWRHDNGRPTHAELKAELEDIKYFRKGLLSPVKIPFQTD